MKIQLLEKFIILTSPILAMALFVMCSSTDVKVAPKQQTVTPEVTTKQAPKVIDKLTVMIHFDFDKTTLTKADILELNKAVTFVKRYPNNKMTIDGYSDIVGTEEYNIKLSERRANVTKDYLVKNAGTKPDNITAMGHGTNDPIGDRKTEAGRAMNRRAVISMNAD